MATEPQPPASPATGDGVRVVETPDVRHDVWLVVALAVAALGLVVGVRSLLRRGAERPASASMAGVPASLARVEAGRPPDAPAAPVPAASPPAETSVRLHARRRPAAQAAARPPDPPSLDAKDVIPALRAAGEQTGIAVFPLPGTKPTKRGIVVPEEFVLPEGYVRHYQTTDDGVRLPAILMFSPDYEWVDGRGVPIALPADGIVPPEMAPPGMPVRMLDVPDAKTPSGREP